ncbi:hypothetical protein PPSIR1_24154 [Plesiocystis pacifica SIR-1]|uniref:Uncharacterized protein n=1 Tax=Plesiocystis pacifica SIR-1 TaxID=391625 RepID=A6GBZ5_9BACT|nr:hypothetical protein [Plesiocystis pacifica]EDM76557.1 hypothetical protein PPSIR1_24154 [Plesiocystis pacifica SIR-1]
MPRADHALALEQALRVDPNDAATWQVYADALNDRGDPRGQLIALHHRRLAAPHDPVVAAAFAEQLARVEARLAERPLPVFDGPHEVDGDDDVVDWSDVEIRPVQLEQRHGFVLSLSMALTPVNLQALAELLAHPAATLLGTLRIHDPSSHLAQPEDYDYDEEWLPQALALDRLDSLCRLDLRRLARLAVEYSPLGKSAIARLAQTESLANLRALDLRYACIGDAGLERLATADALSAVDDWSLQRNRVGARGLRALLGAGPSDARAPLRRLDLRDNPLGPEGAAVIADSPRVAKLERLLAYQRDLGPAGAQALGRASQLPVAIRRLWAGVAHGLAPASAPV